MKKTIRLICTTLASLVVACSPEVPVSTAGLEALSAYVTLDKDLTQFKADFNDASDKVRLVFISGPSCGICLRGMDDLNQSIVASLQNDPRVHTFVVYVPTLGAEEKHVQAAIPLMSGPRVSHYWDEEGISGLDFQKALDISMYAWDVWMIYAPGQVWKVDSTPPMPVFWQHQLPGLPTEQRLDAERFAAVVKEKLVGVTGVSDDLLPSMAEIDEAGLMPVAQPRGVMIQHNHESRGGYQQIKSISAIRYEGWMDMGGESYPLTVETQRPDHYQRTVRNGDELSVISWDGLEVMQDGSQLGLPTAFTKDWLASWEFDDYRDVDGFRLPHQARYFKGDRLLATDHFERVTVSVNDQ